MGSPVSLAWEDLGTFASFLGNAKSATMGGGSIVTWGLPPCGGLLGDLNEVANCIPDSLQ